MFKNKFENKFITQKGWKNYRPNKCHNIYYFVNIRTYVRPIYNWLILLYFWTNLGPIAKHIIFSYFRIYLGPIPAGLIFQTYLMPQNDNALLSNFRPILISYDQKWQYMMDWQRTEKIKLGPFSIRFNFALKTFQFKIPGLRFNKVRLLLSLSLTDSI